LRESKRGIEGRGDSKGQPVMGRQKKKDKRKDEKLEETRKVPKKSIRLNEKPKKENSTTGRER